MTEYVLANLQPGQPETTAQIAERLDMPRPTVLTLLYQRAKGAGGVYRLGGLWYLGSDEGARRISTTSMAAAEARKAIQRFKKPAPPEIRVAQIREPRPFVELTAATIASGRLAIAGAPAMRPGADDHKRIPSLYGEHRVTYKGFNAISPTTRDSTVSGLK